MKQPNAAAAAKKAELDDGWKELHDVFFESLVAFFFPPIHADIDWQLGYEFLDSRLKSS